MKQNRTWQFWVRSWSGEVASSGSADTFLRLKIWSSFFAFRSSMLVSTRLRRSSWILEESSGKLHIMMFLGAFSTSFSVDGQLTLASLPWFLNWFRRALFSDIFGCQDKVQQHPEEVLRYNIWYKTNKKQILSQTGTVQRLWQGSGYANARRVNH